MKSVDQDVVFRQYLFLLPESVRIVLILVAFWGSVQTAELAWGIANIGLGSMAWVNLITLLLLTKPSLAVFKDYERQIKEGKNPVFNPEKLGIEGADFWMNRTEMPKGTKRKVRENPIYDDGYQVTNS